jgi:hypothetical protein
MILRVQAAQATLDQFKERPLKLGLRDCVRMTAAHLRRLGYRIKLPPSGSYRSRRQAVKLLADRGFANLAEALDGLGLERIPPAAAVVGDIVQLPAIDELGALTIAMGNGRVAGYHAAALKNGAVVMQPKEFAGAWRVKPVIA